MRTATTRTVSGRGGGNPPILGLGYTAVRNGPGDYRVNFTQPFRSSPGVSATWEGNVGSGTFTTVLGTVDPGGFLLRLYSSGALTEGTFYFVATGQA